MTSSAGRPPTAPDGTSLTQLVLDVGRDGEGRLVGTVHPAGQAPIDFDGVIELLAAVEGFVDGADGADADGSGAR